MSTFNFYHSGDLGDIIYSLPCIEALGGGNLILGNNNLYKHSIPTIKITPNLVDQFKTILLNQSYIKNILFEHKIKINFNLNKFRYLFNKWNNNELSVLESNKLKQTNIIDLYKNEFGITNNLYIKKWLHTNYSTTLSNIIINRTERYNNYNFPWKQIVNNFKNQIVFLGHKKEYEKFVLDFGNVSYYKTNFKECLEILNGCKLFIGNQSFLYSLAEGLKIPTLQETDTYIPNCCFYRKNSYITNTIHKTDFKKIKSFIINQLLK